MSRPPVDARLLLAVLLAGALLLLHQTWGAGPADPAEIRAPGGLVFDAQSLPTFELILPESSYRNLAVDPFTYRPARFAYRPAGGTRARFVLASVGVRLKGLASFQPIDKKPALKIRFDEYVKRQHFYGLRRLTLNNMAQDPSMVRERLAYHVFRKAGLAAPRCNSARVFINGAYYGLYANVETIDPVFVRSHFGPAPGNLYDLSRETYGIDLEPRWKPFFVLQTNRARADTSDLDELIRAVSVPQAEFVSAAESIVDLDQWLALTAMQAIIADWDSYFGGPNNYMLYHDLQRRRFVLLPWGVDQTFGILNGRFRYMRYPIDGSRANGRLFLRCRASPDCHDRYLGHLEKMLELWDGSDLSAELDRILDQIRPSVYADERRGRSYAEFEQAVDDVRRFLHRRGSVVRLQLATERARPRPLGRDPVT